MAERELFEAVYQWGRYAGSFLLVCSTAHKTMTGTDSSGPLLNVTIATVIQCPNGSFCCGMYSSTCCNDGDGLWIDHSNHKLRNYDPASTTKDYGSIRSIERSISSAAYKIPKCLSTELSPTASTIASTTASITQPSGHPNPARTSSSSTHETAASSSCPSPAANRLSVPSTGSIVDIGLGIAIGLGSLVGLAVYINKKHKSKSKVNGNSSNGDLDNPSGKPERDWDKPEKDGAELVEMDGRPRYFELEGQPLAEKPARECAAIELHGQERPAELEG